MSEKKKFILAVPTIIIIIVAIVGISLIYYNRNFKKMDREDVRTLAQKAALIDNISCEIVTESSEENSEQYVSDYKLKGEKMISKVDGFTIYDDREQKKLLQIDDEQKEVYTYTEYTSSIDDFEAILCTAEKLLESDEYEYTFLKYETFNGVKCVVFSLSNGGTTYDIWLDKSSGMVVQMECHYSSEGATSIDTTMRYRYELNSVTDEDVQEPNLDGYTNIEL